MPPPTNNGASTTTTSRKPQTTAEEETTPNSNSTISIPQQTDEETTPRPVQKSTHPTNSSTNSIPHRDDLPYPYWNLSCPLEMSSFSAAHMGGPDFLLRAEQARQVALPAIEVLQQFLQQHNNKNHSSLPRRIVFIGDSLLRQVFMSLVCHLPKTETEIVVPWFTERAARTHQPNTQARGLHSKFEEARVWFENTEIVFHHGLGGLVALGPDYQSHDTHDWLEDCFRQRPFLEATVVAKSERRMLTERTVQRETIRLQPHDFVVLNGSVHGDRTLNLNAIVDLMRCVADQKKWPHFVYMATGAQHFPTPSGAFEKDLLEQETWKCQAEITRHVQQQEEQRMLSPLLPILGQDVLDLQYKSGHLHVGNRDCLHWIMPGIPDLLAASLVRYLQQQQQQALGIKQ
jgi:hypothetical protein